MHTNHKCIYQWNFIKWTYLYNHPSYQETDQHPSNNQITSFYLESAPAALSTGPQPPQQVIDVGPSVPFQAAVSCASASGCFRNIWVWPGISEAGQKHGGVKTPGATPEPRGTLVQQPLEAERPAVHRGLSPLPGTWAPGAPAGTAPERLRQRLSCLSFPRPRPHALSRGTVANYSHPDLWLWVCFWGNPN